MQLSALSWFKRCKDYCSIFSALWLCCTPGTLNRLNGRAELGREEFGSQHAHWHSKPADAGVTYSILVTKRQHNSQRRERTWKWVGWTSRNMKKDMSICGWKDCRHQATRQGHLVSALQLLSHHCLHAYAYLHAPWWPDGWYLCN